MSGRLVDPYDLVILDLDGVVYLGEEPVPGAAEAIGRLRRDGRGVVYATNNASRSGAEVAALLTRLGIPATGDDVVTSAEVAAAMLAGRVPAGAPTLVVGSRSLREEISAVGLTPVDRADERPAAVVQGYGREVGWSQLAEACLAVRQGARWIATNTDRTLPSPRGPLPGNGAMVAALATALDREPDDVAGKPQPHLFRRVAQRSGARRCLVVGDRLDTDIAGARHAGMDAMVVLTGVAGARDLLAAPPGQRPTHIGTGLGSLFDIPAEVLPDAPADGTRCAGWTVRADGPALTLDGDGEPLDALRALCAVAWSGDRPRASAERQRTGTDGTPVTVAAGSAAAATALERLNLTSLTA